MSVRQVWKRKTPLPKSSPTCHNDSPPPPSRNTPHSISPPMNYPQRDRIINQLHTISTLIDSQTPTPTSPPHPLVQPPTNAQIILIRASRLKRYYENYGRTNFKEIHGKAQAESNPTEPNTDDDIIIELSKEFLMELKNNAYHRMFNEDVVDHIAKGDGKITTWEELVEKFFCKFYPESYDGEDEMLDEGDLAGKEINKVGEVSIIWNPMLAMTKVIKEEFEKLKSLKIGDGSFACNTSHEIFHKEFNRMNRMDDDLFTYKVEFSGLANIPCDLNEDDEQQMTHGSGDDLEYDPSDVEFTEWLASKFYNHKTMDHYTKNALWIYWSRGGDEVELTDEESSDSDDEDEVAEIFRIDTNVFDFKTPMCRAFKEFNYLLQIDPDVRERPWTDNEAWEEPTPIRHHCEPFNYKNGCSEWPTCSWKDDGYYNRGNLPRAYIGGNTLRYQDLEWYEALKDSKLKEEALKNKAIMEGIIDEDDESSNEGCKIWDNFENTNRDNKECEYEMEHVDEERYKVFDDQERPICNIRRFKMIKCSFRDDE
ncbi:hypothetical protein Tco_0266584 [Tanacetum coccineum]